MAAKIKDGGNWTVVTGPNHMGIVITLEGYQVGDEGENQNGVKNECEERKLWELVKTAFLKVFLKVLSLVKTFIVAVLVNKKMSILSKLIFIFFFL